MTQDLVVIEDDCGTSHGSMKALIEAVKVIEALRERILGRVAAAGWSIPETDETVIEGHAARRRMRSTDRLARASTKSVRYAADLRNAMGCAPVLRP